MTWVKIDFKTSPKLIDTFDTDVGLKDYQEAAKRLKIARAILAHGIKKVLGEIDLSDWM